MSDNQVMISYAQNHEDVVLDRALHAPSGFYVDVGAASPLTASVTRHFYDLGWSGINIEPLPEYVAELRRERPRDWTIEAAAGASPGQSSLYVVETDHDLSTFDPRRVEEIAAEGIRTKRRPVEVVTLNDILGQAKPETIDFLKIDVEGAEREVLLGLDLRVWRPRVLLIEATFPNTQIPSHEAWEGHRPPTRIPICIVRWPQSLLRGRRGVGPHPSPGSGQRARSIRTGLCAVDQRRARASPVGLRADRRGDCQKG